MCVCTCVRVCKVPKCKPAGIFFQPLRIAETSWNSNADMLALSNVDIANLLPSNLFTRPEEQEQLFEIIWS